MSVLERRLAAIARGVIYGLALSALALLARPPRGGGGGDGGPGPDTPPLAPRTPDAGAVVVPDYVPDVWPTPVP